MVQGSRIVFLIERLIWTGYNHELKLDYLRPLQINSESLSCVKIYVCSTQGYRGS